MVFCNYVNIYHVRVICTKGKNKQLWKHVMNLIIIQWKCVSNEKQKWRLTIELHMLELCRIMFLLFKLWFLMDHFLSWNFYPWIHTFSPLYCDLHSLKVLHNILFKYLSNYLNKLKQKIFKKIKKYKKD